jgi:hypothetical protein
MESPGNGLGRLSGERGVAGKGESIQSTKPTLRFQLLVNSLTEANQSCGRPCGRRADSTPAICRHEIPYFDFHSKNRPSPEPKIRGRI